MFLNFSFQTASMPALHVQWQTTAEKIAKNTIRGLLQLHKKINGFTTTKRKMNELFHPEQISNVR